MNNRFSWLGVLMITILSGIVVKVIGDPIAAATSPTIEDFFEDVEEFFEDVWDDVEDNLDK